LDTLWLGSKVNPNWCNYITQFLGQCSLIGRLFVKWFALCYWTVFLYYLSVLSCLSVTLVYCDQTVGWIKMKLGMEVGLGPGHIV